MTMINTAIINLTFAINFSKSIEREGNLKISERIKELRSKSNKTVASCARAIGVSSSTFRDWEQGRSISGEPYIKMARLFGISLSELFGIKDGDLSIELKSIEDQLSHLKDHVRNIRSGL